MWNLFYETGGSIYSHDSCKLYMICFTYVGCEGSKLRFIDANIL